MRLLLWLAGCGSDDRPAAWADARSALEAAERGRVQAAIADGVDPGERAVAVELGLVPPTPHAAAPLDGREAGVTAADGRTILDGVRREFHRRVDEATWAAAASTALGVPPAASPEAAIAAAISAGMDEPAAVVRGVEAALAALDPYTRAVWPSQVAAFDDHHQGVVVGVGAAWDLVDGAARLVDMSPGGAAYTSGLHLGDRLVAIDGAPVVDAADGVAALTGPAGTQVAIDVDRGGSRVAAVLERAEAVAPTVFGDRRRADHSFEWEVEPGVVWIRVGAFRPHTDDELVDHVSQLSPDAVILDLRGNPGGDVQAALNVVDLWVDGGRLVEMVGRAAPLVEAPADGEAAWNDALPGGPFVGVPTAVLTDRDTASAAEIVAVALRAHAGAMVIGGPTAGKVASQALRSHDRVAWQVTNLEWQVPGAPPILAGVGLTPDVLSVAGPAERWQVERMTRRREAVRVHADGTEAVPPPVGVHPGLPALDVDITRAQALRWAAEATRR